MIPLDLTEVEFETAFAEFQRWGPETRVPVEVRWRAVLPQLPPDQIQRLLEFCKEIESFAIEVAANVVYHGLAADAATQQISQRYPLLNAAQLRRTLSQACYFAAK